MTDNADRERLSALADNLLDEHGEVVVRLADGWTLRSGVYYPNDPEAPTSGEYVRLVDPEGVEYAYWDQDEWATDPALVMGAIINSAAGVRLELYPRQNEGSLTDKDVAPYLADLDQAQTSEEEARAAVDRLLKRVQSKVQSNDGTVE